LVDGKEVTVAPYQCPVDLSSDIPIIIITKSIPLEGPFLLDIAEKPP